MNDDQIQKFINACKNAGFEVDEPESCARGVFRTRIIVADNVCIQRTEYSNDDATFYLHIDGSYEGTKDFKPLIATYLLEAIKKKFQVVTIGTVSDGDWATTVPFGHICKSEKFADAVFEAFCEVYK